MNYSGVYVIENTINGNIYVGSAVNMNVRRYNHFANLGYGEHCNRHLQNAFNLYGKDAFKFWPQLICEKHELIRYEQFFIDWLGPEYNICPKAGSNLGMMHTAEARAKMSAVGIGKHPMSDAHKAKIVASRKGKHLSDEHKAKISAAGNGKHTTSDEARAKMSVSRKGKRTHPMSDENKAKLLAANRGRHHSDEAKAKLSVSHKGKPWSKARREAFEKHKAYCEEAYTDGVEGLYFR